MTFARNFLLQLLIGTALLLAPRSASAACSGSGLTWSCTAGSTVANVQSAINGASDGAAITFAAGSYTWNSGISLNGKNGITLICQTVRSCNVSFSGNLITIDDTPAEVTAPIRVSGFVFSGSPSTAAIWFLGTRDIKQIRIDHNTFTNLGDNTIAIMVGATDAQITGYVYGVIDHNIFNGTDAFMALKVLTGKTWPTGLPGSANNIFVEDNQATFTANAGYLGFVDSWMATGIVVRYNTLNNTRIVSHGSPHGGPANTEWYGNTITSPVTADYRNMHHQGSGEIMVFNNSVSGGHIALLHYRSDVSQLPSGSVSVNQVCDGTQSGTWPDGNRLPTTTHRGYPCWHQPGRDQSLTLKPVYLWGNKDQNNAIARLSIESGGYINSHLIENRDYYDAVSAAAQTSPSSPFNGTAGVGFGTLSNRPAICTTNAQESGGGVGYFATDQGPQGTLYRCSATNTWTVHYVPYTYPHPLQGGPTDSTAPSAPTQLRLSAN